MLDPMVKKGWVEVHGVREARMYNTSDHAQVGWDGVVGWDAAGCSIIVLCVGMELYL